MFRLPTLMAFLRILSQSSADQDDETVRRSSKITLVRARVKTEWGIVQSRELYSPLDIDSRLGRLRLHARRPSQELFVAQ
jgi:hypothetical protein